MKAWFGKRRAFICHRFEALVWLRRGHWLDGLGGQLFWDERKTLVVFGPKQPRVVTMDKPWYRKMFSQSSKPALKVTHANADYGDAEVQFGMGLKFANSAGAAQDYVQAAEWYRKAADQSHSLAQFNLGMMYAQGQGVTQDDAQSVMWFGKAAQQGDAGAQFNLAASCYRASLAGVPKDALESRIEAYKWYHLAAAQGYKKTDSACSTLILRMTREDVAAGDQRIAEFEVKKPNHPRE